MDTFAIRKVFKKIARIYNQKNKEELVWYVLPCDLLPKKRDHKKDLAIIVNTDTSYGSGSHWQAIWIPKRRNVCYFFDSYGRQATNNFIREFIHKNSTNYTCPFIQFQDFNSTCCGEYCCLFILSFVQKLRLECFIKQFEKNKNNFKANDELVQKLFKRYFKNVNNRSLLPIQSCKSFFSCRN